MRVRNYAKEAGLDFAPILVISGTHSSGKSTLLNHLREGVVSSLVDVGDEDDLGYGVVATQQCDIPLILVPEAARRVAVDLHRDGGLLAGRYSLATQYEIDAQHVIRTGFAAALANGVAEEMYVRGLAGHSKPLGMPVVITDRGPLDGLVYSRLAASGQDVSVVDGFPREWFLKSFTKESVWSVLFCDHNEVELVDDGARREDVEFRQQVARSLMAVYASVSEKPQKVISGDVASRLWQVRAEIGRISGESSACFV